MFSKKAFVLLLAASSATAFGVSRRNALKNAAAFSAAAGSLSLPANAVEVGGKIVLGDESIMNQVSARKASLQMICTLMI